MKGKKRNRYQHNCPQGKTKRNVTERKEEKPIYGIIVLKKNETKRKRKRNRYQMQLYVYWHWCRCRSRSHWQGISTKTVYRFLCPPVSFTAPNISSITLVCFCCYSRIWKRTRMAFLWSTCGIVEPKNTPLDCGGGGVECGREVRNNSIDSPF